MAKKITNPIEIANWRRSETERIKVCLERYRGRNVVSLRTWWRNKKGEECPGKDGITLDVDHVIELAKAFKRARKQAAKAGLIDQ